MVHFSILQPITVFEVAVVDHETVEAVTKFFGVLLLLMLLSLLLLQGFWSTAIVDVADATVFADVVDVVEPITAEAVYIFLEHCCCCCCFHCCCF